MLEQEQLIGNAVGLALLDELLLKLQRFVVRDQPEPPDFEESHRPYPTSSSNFSSRSLTKVRKRPASAPSISRWS